MRITTLKEQGQKLPIGMVGGDSGRQLLKDFTLREHNAKTDRLLNIWREANKGQHIAWEVCKYLSLIVESIGGESVTLDAKGDSTPETTARFMQLYFGDAMYLWMFSRIAAVEEKCEIPYMCPRCAFKGKAIVDLWGTEVLVIDTVKELEKWVELKKGIKLTTGKRAMSVCVTPAPLTALMFSGATAESTDSLGYGQLRECISKVKGVEGRYNLKDEELDTISKMDWLRLDRIAGKVTGGPKMRTPIDCEGSLDPDEGEDNEPQPCGNTISRALDWSYDAFFDSSVPLASLMS